MLSITSKSATGRMLARVAVAGAVAAIPLAALAVPATAEPGAPTVTEVRHHHPRNCHGNWGWDLWDNDWNGWNQWDRCDGWPGNGWPGNGHWGWPRGSFGSS
ncbi:hypothetical protein [Nocardia lijiangensis]|uniref:hypothetical protein n=1 Tax=Nocardia lijiangensis TaxID=299618 RepID=UPI000A45EB88|nr:hypothetical protein [Nocardia lijiangensis]